MRETILGLCLLLFSTPAWAQYNYGTNPGSNCSFPLLNAAPAVTINLPGQKIYPACYVTQGNDSWSAGMLYVSELGIWDIASEDLGIYSWVTPNLGFALHISNYGQPYANGFGGIGWDDGVHRGRAETTLSLGYPGIVRAGLLVDGNQGDASGQFQAASYKVGTCELHSGVGDPNGAIYAPVCSTYLRADGIPGHTLYVKESEGASAQGWVGK